MKTKIKESMLRGNPVWICDYKIEGERKRKYFPTQREAEAFAKNLGREEQKFGQTWVAMEADVRFSLARVLAEIQAKGITLEEVWNGYQAYVNMLTKANAKTEMQLGEAVKTYCEQLEDGGCRAKYIWNMQSLLKRFAKKRERMLVSEVTAGVFEEFFQTLRDQKLSSLTQRSYKARFHAFCTWSQKCGIMPRGTDDEQTPVSGIKINKSDEVKQIRIVSVQEAEELLRVTALHAPKALAYLICAMFCGVRPEECTRVQFKDFDLDDERQIDLDSDKTKTRWPRLVPIPENVIPWMRLVRDLGFWGEPEDYIISSEKISANVRAKFWVPLIGKGWQPDMLRHSTASYLFVMTDNIERVGRWLGNTPVVLREHYIRDVRKEKAEAFFKITPPAGLLEAALKAKTEREAAVHTHLAKVRGAKLKHQERRRLTEQAA
jgi:integrase